MSAEWDANLLANEIGKCLYDQAAYLNSPAYQRELAQHEAQWRARPWWERARILTSNWIDDKRRRLGEIIAGQRFE